MKNSLNVLFMGTPEFAVDVLDQIKNSNHNIVGVVSIPDKPAGRGQKIHESAVTKYAKKYNLNLFQPEKLKSKSFLAALEKLEIDVMVVVAFRMLPKVVWEIPAMGTFNLHASLLPLYRGAAPINWAIINGETTSGVTTFMIDEKIDTGNILLQREVDILPDDNAGDLHDKLMQVGGDLVIETLNGLADDTIIPKPQKKVNELKNAPKIYKEDCIVNWNLPMEKIYNFIRGLSPYPAAYTTLYNDNEQKNLKIYKTNIQYTCHAYIPKNVVIDNQNMGIAHKDGIIWLEEVQLEGKRRMDALDFANGFKFSSDARVGD